MKREGGHREKEIRETFVVCLFVLLTERFWWGIISFVQRTMRDFLRDNCQTCNCTICLDSCFFNNFKYDFYICLC